MNICDCYHIENGKSMCWGTPEMSECHCDGDRTGCTLFSYISDKALGRKDPDDIYELVKKVMDKKYKLAFELYPGGDYLLIRLEDAANSQKVANYISIYELNLSRDPNKLIYETINGMLSTLDQVRSNSN